MSYTIKKMSFDDAKSKVRDYPRALLYYMSSLEYKPTADCGDIDWKECIEARFFSDKEELHIFKDEDEFECVIVGDDVEEDVSYKTYELANRYRRNGEEKLTVKEYLDYDEDGQVFVKATRLSTSHQN